MIGYKTKSQGVKNKAAVIDVVAGRSITEMKKKLVTILLTIVATTTFGYLFLLSGLLGFLTSKYVAGKSDGERGKVGSIVIPFRRWGFHLHHWLYSLCLISLSAVTGSHFLTPIVTWGLMGGLVFQGIYCYSDWHIILIRRTPNKSERLLMPASEAGDSN